jgi:hypothetical protein
MRGSRSMHSPSTSPSVCAIPKPCSWLLKSILLCFFSFRDWLPNMVWTKGR